MKRPTLQIILPNGVTHEVEVPEDLTHVLWFPTPDPDPYTTTLSAIADAMTYGIKNNGAMNETELERLQELATFVSQMMD
jgi:hypothetical protein